MRKKRKVPRLSLDSLSVFRVREVEGPAETGTEQPGGRGMRKKMCSRYKHRKGFRGEGPALSGAAHALNRRSLQCDWCLCDASAFGSLNRHSFDEWRCWPREDGRRGSMDGGFSNSGGILYKGGQKNGSKDDLGVREHFFLVYVGIFFQLFDSL